jgi:hypothetical protein
MAGGAVEADEVKPVQELIGHLDAVTSSGFLEGWAADRLALERPVHVRVQQAGRDVALGLANLYREDLAQAHCGTGWCAFRLRSHMPPGKLRSAPLTLSDRVTGKIIHEGTVPRLIMDGDPLLASVAELLDNDPTVLRQISQLRACEPVFQSVIASQGAAHFVALAYGYVLQRPPDDDGLALYAGYLETGSLTAFRVLEALAESQEFLDRRPQLSAPATAAFPFHA